MADDTPDQQQTLLFLHGMQSRYGKTSAKQMEAQAEKYATKHGMKFEAIPISGDTPKAQRQAAQARVDKGGVGAVLGFSAGGYTASHLRLPKGTERIMVGAPRAKGNQTFPGGHMEQVKGLSRSPGPGPQSTAPASGGQQKSEGSDPKAFIVHHTGSHASPGDVVKDWKTRKVQPGSSGTGSHFIMDRNGVIHNVKQEFGYSGHGHMSADNAAGPGKGLSSENTIGLEVVAKNDADVTPKQREAARAFIEKNYPNVPVYGHGEVEIAGYREASEGMSIVRAVRQDRGGSRSPQASSGAPQAGGYKAGDHPYQYGGKLTIDDPRFAKASFSYGTGGRGRGSAPFGSYPLGPQERSPQWGFKKFDVGGPGGTMYDPKIGATRSAIEMHPGGSKSAGCISVNAKQFPQLAHITTQLQKEWGKAYVNLMPDGRATISKEPIFDTKKPENLTPRAAEQRVATESAKQNVVHVNPGQGQQGGAPQGKANQAAGLPTMGQLIQQHQNDPAVQQHSWMLPMIPDQHLPIDQWGQKHGNLVNDPRVPQPVKDIFTKAIAPPAATSAAAPQQPPLPQARPQGLDYDYTAAQAAGVKPDARGHLPDTYKLPNHPTFSNESIYHGQNGAEGGQWQGSDQAGWSFAPGKTNMERYTPEQLRSYFQQNEPGASLVLPGQQPAGQQARPDQPPMAAPMAAPMAPQQPGPQATAAATSPGLGQQPQPSPQMNVPAAPQQLPVQMAQVSAQQQQVVQPPPGAGWGRPTPGPSFSAPPQQTPMPPAAAQQPIPLPPPRPGMPQSIGGEEVTPQDQRQIQGGPPQGQGYGGGVTPQPPAPQAPQAPQAAPAPPPPPPAPQPPGQPIQIRPDSVQMPTQTPGQDRPVAPQPPPPQPPPQMPYGNPQPGLGAGTPAFGSGSPVVGGGMNPGMIQPGLSGGSPFPFSSGMDMGGGFSGGAMGGGMGGGGGDMAGGGGGMDGGGGGGGGHGVKVDLSGAMKMIPKPIQIQQQQLSQIQPIRPQAPLPPGAGDQGGSLSQMIMQFLQG